ncbi:MAG: hypothetical protein AAB906_02510, partial [Patescibacteria group bacterium]
MANNKTVFPSDPHRDEKNSLRVFPVLCENAHSSAVPIKNGTSKTSENFSDCAIPKNTPAIIKF